MVGSGQFGTPWERMHRANVSIFVIACRTKAWGQSLVATHCSKLVINDLLVFGSRCWQALWAA
jgi:hypothetical protein